MFYGIAPLVYTKIALGTEDNKIMVLIVSVITDMTEDIV
jgi:hypothetical protein